MANVMLRINQTILGEDVFNVFYAGSNIDPIINGQAVADMVYDAYFNTIRGSLSNQWQLLSITLKDVDTAGTPSIDYAPTQGIMDGGSSSSPLLTQAALLIKYSSSTPSPNRGRKYIPGMTENTLDNGRFTAAAVQDGVDLIQALQNGLSSQFNSGLLIARLEGNPRVLTDANGIQTITGSTNPSTQRRRRLSN